MDIIRAIEQQQIREDLPPFAVGDTVKVHYKIIEGTRERTQVFQGVVIRRHGAANRETFTVRKICFGVGVERTFPVHSPKIEKIEIVSQRQGPPRQALLPPRQGRQGRPPQGEGLLGRSHARTQHCDSPSGAAATAAPRSCVSRQVSHDEPERPRSIAEIRDLLAARPALALDAARSTSSPTTTGRVCAAASRRRGPGKRQPARSAPAWRGCTSSSASSRAQGYLVIAGVDEVGRAPSPARSPRARACCLRAAHRRPRRQQAAHPARASSSHRAVHQGDRPVLVRRTRAPRGDRRAGHHRRARAVLWAERSRGSSLSPTTWSSTGCPFGSSSRRPRW